MKVDDRYCTSVWADEKTYVDDADYRDFIAKRIQDDIAKALIVALCTKDAIVAIKGDSTTRKDEFRSGIICRQDVYIKDLVQCKDCKYSTPQTFYDKGVKGLFCNYRGSIGDWRYRTADDFCSRGERKDEAKE